MKARILFLAANPSGAGPLELAREQQQITEKIRDADYRDAIEFIPIVATRPDDLLRTLLSHKPHVVHFSGHGIRTEKVVLLDDQGRPKPFSKTALVSIFRVLKKNVRLVVLNACYTRPQAEAIAEVIDCTIGTTTSIRDDAAIVFAANVYRAIGFGESVKSAVDIGRAALINDFPGEAAKIELLSRPGVDSARVLLVQPSGAADRDAMPAALPLVEDAILFLDALAGLEPGEFDAVKTAIGVPHSLLHGGQLQQSTQVFRYVKRESKLPALKDLIVHYYAAAFDK
jgi:hypothetical protein